MTFWLLNALSKVYTTDISHPVVFIVNDAKGGVAQVTPSTLCLKVTGGGWQLLRYLLRLNVQPIELPVAQVSERGKIRSEHLYPIVAKKIKDLKVCSVWIDEVHCVHTSS